MRSTLIRLWLTIQFLAKSALLLTAIATVVLIFQNCGQLQADNSLLTNSSIAGCVDPRYPCATPTNGSSDLNAVQLVIANQEPVTVRASGGGSNGVCDATNCVDVAGYCTTGIFANNIIYVEIQGPVNLAETPATKCNAMGRFRVLVPMPTGFVKGALYTLIVTLRVFDATNTRLDNPSGLGRKQITLTSTQ